tara:strand:+ start:4060 stop:5586 length:1527 start_codon:yes stop_codon:yes gene_type:complete
MANEYLSAITPGTNLTVPDFDGNGPGTSTGLATGDVRRKYNFGDRFSELMIAQDPFFRFLSKVSKNPTDDPQFKFTDKRGSFHKRYAYPVAVYNGSWKVDQNVGSKSATNTMKVRMASDYLSQGNQQNVFGQDGSNEIKIGADGTMPKFFMEGQLVKFPTAAAADSAPTDYIIARVTKVTEYAKTGAGNDASGTAANPDMVELETVVIKGSSGTHFTSPGGLDDQSYKPSTKRIHDQLEPQRCYVVGTAHSEGSGYPETWADQPFSSNHGLTQIWKTSMAMTNTARATQLKFDSSEWARVWKEKLVEHKWDLETSLLFGSQYSESSTGIQYTQGAADYILNYGNSFTLSTESTSADDFLNDMSNYVDPRYNGNQATVYFCNTAVYNWLHKLGGYFKNNLELSPNLNADMAISGKKKVFGVDITVITTPYGDMNVARNIHLDGTNVKMMGINMKNCSWRPLVGNGVNRDTSVYVGVQTLENSGVDRRVDLILTEGGMEWRMPESHAIWK